MDTSTLIPVFGTFYSYVGEMLAELKRQRLADIDIELLALKKTQLEEKLDEFKSELEAAVVKEKADAEQDLISRGMSNTTIRQSTLRAIEGDAGTQLEKALREYNRAIEELALMERKVREQSYSWWKRLFRFGRT